MDTAKKYRLGNQPEIYELKESFLGWKPENDSWDNICYERVKNISLILISPDGEERISLFLHQFISKDAFPMSFLSEEKSKYLNHFAIVSAEKGTEQFIIPFLLD